MRLATVVLLVCAACRGRFDDLPEATAVDTQSPDGDPVAISVQRGTTSLAVGQLARTVPIANVQLEHAFLLFEVSAPTLDPSEGLVAGTLASSSIDFERPGGAVADTISWQVVELATATVERGVHSEGSNTITVLPITIGAAEPARSFVTRSVESNGVGYDEDDYIRVRLVDATTLELHSGAPGGAGRLPDQVAYQVVSLADATAVHGIADFPQGTAEQDIQIDADPAHAFAAHTWYTDADNGDVGSVAIRATLAPARLALHRGRSDLPANAAWSVVSVPSARVQHGEMSFAAGNAMAVVPIDAVDVSRSFVLVHGGETPYSGIQPNDRAGITWFRADLDASTITLTRDDAIDAATVTWSVVSF